MKETARSVAQKILLKCELEGGYANLALDHALDKTKLESADRALATELVFGTIERKITLDYTGNLQRLRIRSRAEGEKIQSAVFLKSQKRAGKDR